MKQQPLRSRRDYGYVDLEEELKERKKQIKDEKQALEELIEVVKLLASIEG